MMLLVLGTPTGEVAARFLLHARRQFARLGVDVRAALSDIHPQLRPDCPVAGRPAA
jgi:hypothetical protein